MFERFKNSKNSKLTKEKYRKWIEKRSFILIFVEFLKFIFTIWKVNRKWYPSFSISPSNYECFLALIPHKHTMVEYAHALIWSNKVALLHALAKIWFATRYDAGVWAKGNKEKKPAARFRRSHETMHSCRKVISLLTAEGSFTNSLLSILWQSINVG